MSNCYLCGSSPATNKLELKESFTAHSLAKCPQSNKLCNECHHVISLRAYYFNPNKEKYSLLYSRNWSWLYHGDTLIYPKFDGDKDGFPIVENLPTREIIREWLVNPPIPPFTIAIAESGQKHILFLAQEAQSRELFPVQFELDTLFIKRGEFISILDNFEFLMGLGATKTEIVSGCYKSQFLLKHFNNYQQYDDQLVSYRGSRLLELVSYVAITKVVECLQKDTTKLEPVVTPVDCCGQLTLF